VPDCSVFASWMWHFIPFCPFLDICQYIFDIFSSAVGSPQLMQFQVVQIKTFQKIIIINIEILTCLKHAKFFLMEMKEQWGGDGGGILLGKSTHAVTPLITDVDSDDVDPNDMVPVSSSSSSD
jgi:hypothetical protein